MDVETVSLANWTEEDMLNHPAWYDAVWCYFLLCQIGDPRVPGTCATVINYFSLYSVLLNIVSGSVNNKQIGGDGDVWSMAPSSVYMPTGLGTGNHFMTPQGGARLGRIALLHLQPSQSGARHSGALVDWNAATSASIVGYTLSGPDSGLVGNPLAYALTPAGTITDVITFSDGGAGGTFFPSSITLTNTSVVQTFSYTPASSGTKTLTITSADRNAVTGSPVTLTVAAAGYTLSGPASAFVGNPAAFALTPSGLVTDVITFSDGGAGGAFLPASMTISDSSSTQTFSYTPSSPGTKILTITSADGGPVIGSPVTLSVPHVSYILSGPAIGFVGYAIAYALTPSGMANDTITFSDNGDGGTFYPATLSVNGSLRTQTFSYVPGSNGTKTLTITSSEGGTITGSPLSLSVSTITQKLTKKWFGGLRSQRPITRFNCGP